MLRTLSVLALVVSMANAVLSAPKAKFQSPTITKATSGRSVKIDVDITGAKELFLVVTDAGNGFGCDWADWVEPRLVGPKGELKLTELKWLSAASGFKTVNLNKNVEGNPLVVNGKPVEYGIGTHANSIISYSIPACYTKFKATGGLTTLEYRNRHVETSPACNSPFIRKNQHFSRQPLVSLRLWAVAIRWTRPPG